MDYAAETNRTQQAERKSTERLTNRLYGRFMLENQSEHPCSVLDISSTTLVLGTDQSGQPGEKVIAYLEQLGRLEGLITRRMDGGFEMTLIVSEHKREKLEAQLRWLHERDHMGRPEDRRHDRIAPRNPMSVLALADGRKYNCRIIDLSLSGAAIEVEVKPALGMTVMLGTMRGRVVRHFEEGVALEFASIQPAEQLEDQATQTTASAA